jgi:DUF2075 family protein/DNA replication protein DnaC
MSNIKTLPFNKNSFSEIRKYHFGCNWPVVYVLENSKEIYIGETTSLYNRSRQHYENPERAKLKNIHIITDEEYNKSAALDIESMLIQYISAEGTLLLQNGNHGLSNHNYYEKEKYKAKFETVWEKLKEMGKVKKDLIQIKNSDIFKYSPYKALTEDQIRVTKKIIKNIKINNKKTHIINGKPGTGKTILAIYLIKRLREIPETKNLNVALVIPMTSLRKTLKKVFKNISGLKPNMVIGPNEVINKKYDILIIDEAHRLKRRINISHYATFDTTNRHLDLGNGGTELDWIKLSSKHQILFYDKNQSIRPTDIRHEQILQLDALKYELETQMRVLGGEEYINFVDGLFNLKDISTYKISDYEFKICDSVYELVDTITVKNKEHGLARIVAGYAWPWKTKKGGEFDIEIGGLKLIWNSTNQDWVNSPNSINEVGCIHTVQGYDLNYTGVIIGPELSYDKTNNKLVVDAKKYMDINGKRSITDPAELERYIINIYKTLLTRGIMGTYIYIVDDKLREYFKSKN